MFDVEDRARPILKWPGGKSSLLPQLVPHFPTEFNRYIEPFTGGGAVFLALRPGTSALISDFNPELATLYEVVKWMPDELMGVLDAMEKEYNGGWWGDDTITQQEYYYKIRAWNPKTDLKTAARTIFLNKTCFNGLYRQNGKGEFNAAWGKYAQCPSLYNEQNVRDVLHRLETATIACGDFEDVIDQAGEGDFVYCDPPYVDTFTRYKAGGFDMDDQLRLEAACWRAYLRGAQVAISNSKAAEELYHHKWDIQEVTTRRNINRDGTGRGELTEIVALLLS